MKAPKTLVHAVGQRLSGGQPSRWRASVAATAVGVTVYRVLRDK
jgi:hypothetical protein